MSRRRPEWSANNVAPEPDPGAAGARERFRQGNEPYYDWATECNREEDEAYRNRLAERTPHKPKTPPWWMKVIPLPRIQRPKLRPVDWGRFWTPLRQRFARLSTNQQIVVGISSVGMLLLVLFVWFFWPSQYRYDTIQTSSRGKVTIRTHRITGETATLTPHGWR